MINEKRKVAIIFSNWDYYPNDQNIPSVNSITEWSEVNDEEYRDLMNGVSVHNRKTNDGIKMTLIELPKQRECIFSTIEKGKEYLARIRREDEKRKKDIERKKQEDKERREKRKKEKDTATREEKQRMYELLQRELGIVK